MLLRLVTLALLVYLGFGLLIYLTQRSLMYFQVPERTADDVAVEYLDGDGVTLKLWVVNPGRETAVLYFGGNAEDVYANASDLQYWLPEHTAYLINYRGYGGSGGSPSEQGLFADALRVYDQLSARHARIDAIGRSLGSGVAVFLASKREVGRLVLVTPHDSAVSLARRMYPIYPVALMMWDRFDSVSYAPYVTAPTMLVTAQHDRLVPAEHSTSLLRAFAPGIAREVVIANGGHNDLSGYTDYWEQIAAFLR